MISQPVFILQECPAENRWHAEGTEKTRRDIHPARSLRGALPPQVKRNHRVIGGWPGSQVFEDGVLRLPVDETGWTNEFARDALLRIMLPQHHQSLFIRERQGFQKGRPDHAEHGSVRTDAQGQGGCCEHGKPGSPL